MAAPTSQKQPGERNRGFMFHFQKPNPENSTAAAPAAPAPGPLSSSLAEADHWVTFSTFGFLRGTEALQAAASCKGLHQACSSSEEAFCCRALQEEFEFSNDATDGGTFDSDHENENDDADADGGRGRGGRTEEEEALAFSLARRGGRGGRPWHVQSMSRGPARSA